jgi:hypothetical protein
MLAAKPGVVDGWTGNGGTGGIAVHEQLTSKTALVLGQTRCSSATTPCRYALRHRVVRPHSGVNEQTTRHGSAPLRGRAPFGIAVSITPSTALHGRDHRGCRGQQVRIDRDPDLYSS